MSEDKDRIADALAALSAGHVDDDEHAPPADPHDDAHAAHADHVDPDAADQPAAPAVPPTSRPARPTAPGSRAPAPVKTPPVPADPPPAAPAPVAKLRPAVPGGTSAPAGSGARPARPERPSTPAHSAAIPAAPVTSSSSYRPPTASRRKPRVPMYATLSFRQTIIPICLSMGVGLLLAMLGWFMLDPDHPARGVGAWAPITIGVVGLAVLGLGIANMLSVQKILKQPPQ